MVNMQKEQSPVKTFLKTLNKIDKDKSIKGLFLRVNSPGGSGFASEIIRQRLELLNKNSNSNFNGRYCCIEVIGFL